MWENYFLEGYVLKMRSRFLNLSKPLHSELINNRGINNFPLLVLSRTWQNCHLTRHYGNSIN
ncbi:MAG: hypothetical protein MUD14_08600 [Hydrococcus sp. Prado102]|nr:hypothetical protein [Hydrococcus sp. Prado102]